jgi:low temperature requirement protein LtrA
LFNYLQIRQNFWLLSYTLCFSRAVLAAQYTIALCARARPVRLKLPLALNALVFLVSGSIFIGFTRVFTRVKSDNVAGSSTAYVIWYLVLLFELVAILQISHKWKEISFANTHLTERMGLLTLIVIGEGAIGASKTTIEMMGRRALEVEPILLVVCIILILVSVYPTRSEHIFLTSTRHSCGSFISTIYPPAIMVPPGSKAGQSSTCPSTFRS